MTHYFSDIPQSTRPVKPRSSGATFIIDWGIGPVQQQDLLRSAAEFVDLAKIAVGIPGLLPARILDEKVQIYQQHQVHPFPGGQFLKHAYVHGCDDAYLPAVQKAGFNWVEVSDNLADVLLAWKAEMIHRAVNNFGMQVMGEVGKKAGGKGGTAFVDDARTCRDAGAAYILLEAAELVSNDPEIQRDIVAVVDVIGLEQIMFGLPSSRIEGVHACDIHTMRRQLISDYGPNVNIGNCDPTDLINLEAYRRKLGANAGGKTCQHGFE